MMRYLSHKLSRYIPVYGLGNREIDLKEIKSIVKGDTCQTYWIGIENHWGTHVDCPAHFFKNGKRVVDYEADFWLFHCPQVLSINVKPGQIIFKSDLSGNINPEADLLILKSGWGKIRGKDVYSIQNPGLDPIVGLWLREEYPLLRAVGFDWISLSSYSNRELGREAHKMFLDPEKTGHPILIIEDMFLFEDMKGLKQVLVAPLRVEDIDGAPCTIIGIF